MQHPKPSFDFLEQPGTGACAEAGQGDKLGDGINSASFKCAQNLTHAIEARERSRIWALVANTASIFHCSAKSPPASI